MVTMMKPSSFYRSIKHIISSCSSLGDVRGCSLVILRRYTNVTDIQDDTEPFSLIDPNRIPGLGDTWRDENMSCEILRPGMILLKNYVNILGQTGIINTCQKWGVGPAGFYEPKNQYGHELRRHITSFGKNWDPLTGYNNPYRSDGSEPPAIPYELVHLTKTAIEVAQGYMDDLPSMYPDTCLVSHYSTCGRLGLHQDTDESADSLKKGLSVVSISVGDAAEFWYGDTRDENKLRNVILDTGDVLIFGGKSRLIFHGVKSILPGYSVNTIEIAKIVMKRPGRLNVTLKQF